MMRVLTKGTLWLAATVCMCTGACNSFQDEDHNRMGLQARLEQYCDDGMPAIMDMPEDAAILERLGRPDEVSETELIDLLEHRYCRELLLVKMRGDAAGLFASAFRYFNSVSEAAHFRLTGVADRKTLRAAWLRAVEEGRPQTTILLARLSASGLREANEDILLLLTRLDKPGPKDMHYAYVVAIYEELLAMRVSSVRPALENEQRQALVDHVRPKLGMPATDLAMERMWRRIGAVVMENGL